MTEIKLAPLEIAKRVKRARARTKNLKKLAMWAEEGMFPLTEEDLELIRKISQ